MTTIEWIPVDEEHLPELGKIVLLSDEFGDTTIGRLVRTVFIHDVHRFNRLAWEILNFWEDGFEEVGITDREGKLTFSFWCEKPKRE